MTQQQGTGTVTGRITGQRSIDLNSDMGEAFGAYRMGPDADLLRYVTSANIACGFHAGDPRTMDATVAGATAAGVKIGAHVSYPDLVGFGRRHIPGKRRRAHHGCPVPDRGAGGVLPSARHGRPLREGTRGAVQRSGRRRDPGWRTGGGGPCLRGRAVGVDDARGSPSVKSLRKGRRPGRAGGVRRPGLYVRRPPRLPQGGRISDNGPDCWWPTGGGAWHWASRSRPQMGGRYNVHADSICVHSDTPGSVALAAALREAIAGAAVQVRAFS